MLPVRIHRAGIDAWKIALVECPLLERECV